MILIPLITIFGTAGFFIWLIVYLFVLNQEKGEKLVEWLSSILSWTSKKAEQTATATKIQNKIKSFINSVNSEVKGLLPFELKIKWISPNSDKNSFIEKDQVIIMLNHHNNQDENIARATILYINKALIPEARPHIHTKLNEAIDLMMTKKALGTFTESRSSLGHFVNTVLRPRTEKDTDLKNMCSVIDSIDERGLFTRVLLKELMELGISRAGITENGDTVFETGEFIKLLKLVANKERGVDINPTFIKNNIRVSLVMVARPEKIALGTNAYTQFINKKLKESVRTFYIFSRGERNIEFCKEVVSVCNGKFDQLSLSHEEEYPTKMQNGNILPSYCAIFYNRKII